MLRFIATLLVPLALVLAAGLLTGCGGGESDDDTPEATALAISESEPLQRGPEWMQAPSEQAGSSAN